MALDRFIRMPLAAVTQLQLRHACSEADIDAPAASSAGAAATVTSDISGYTEWLSDSTPVVSVGWDWFLAQPCGNLALRTASIRTNLMLQDERGVDVGFGRTTSALAAWLAQWDWQSEVRRQLQISGICPPSP